MKQGEKALPGRGRPSSGGWKRWGVPLAAAALGAAAALLFVYLPVGWRSEAPISVFPGLGSQGTQATLYFADPRWTNLMGEARALQLPADGAARLRTLVEALAEGPHQAGSPVLAKGTKLRGAYLGRGGLAVIDFEQDLDLGGGGPSGELLTVYALVQTIATNVPGVQSVQILVNGQERETLAGHVKISEPIRPDPQWVTAQAR